MDLCNNSEELEIFETSTIDKLIEFKWGQYGQVFHVVGCCFHFLYLAMLIAYINIVYVLNTAADYHALLSTILALGILYPALYDFTQMFKAGFPYFVDLWNYSDIAYIFCSIANIVSQKVKGPFALPSKILMIVIILISLMKTFFFLRIFNELSPIVTMLINVVSDLKQFLLFYTILISLFSLLFGILEVGNSSEYEKIGTFVGNWLTTLRMSMGDFSFDQATLLEREQNIMYWFSWFLIVIITCVIFLNFIIAEASASYEKVSEKLDAVILKSKGALIGEAEEMMPRRMKGPNFFPKYIIVREMEE